MGALRRSSALAATTACWWVFFLQCAFAAEEVILWDLPNCIDAQAGEALGYTAQSGGGVQLNLEINNWASSRVVGLVTAILLQDVMQYDVVVSEEGPNWLDPGGNNVLSRVHNSTKDINMEVWPSGKDEWIEQFVNKGNVQNVGIGGYTTHEGIYLPPSVETEYGHLAAEYWKMLHQPEILELYRFDHYPTGKDEEGNWICPKEKYAFCDNGQYVPERCRHADSNCIQVFKGDPQWSPSVLEQLLTKLDVNATVIYHSYAEYDELQNRLASATPQMPYLQFAWIPDVYTSLYDMRELIVPLYTEKCWHDHAGDPFNPQIGCGWPYEHTWKVASNKLVDKAPEADAFVRDVYIGDIDISSMLRPMGSDNLNAYEAACQWVRNHTDVWGDWVPTKRAALSFLTEDVRVQLPASDAVVTLLREETPIGAVTAVVSDVTAEQTGMDGTLAVAGTDYVFLEPLTVAFPDRASESPTVAVSLLSPDAPEELSIFLSIASPMPESLARLGGRRIVRVVLVPAPDDSNDVTLVALLCTGGAMLCLTMSVVFFVQRHRQARRALMDEARNMVPFESLELDNELGRGQFGKVYKARFRGSVVAVKVILGDLEENMVEMVKRQSLTAFSGTASGTPSGGSGSGSSSEITPFSEHSALNSGTTMTKLTATANVKKALRSSASVPSRAQSQSHSESYSEAKSNSTTSSSHQRSKRDLAVRQFEQEVDMMIKLRHPNIVLLIASCPFPRPAIIMEFVDMGSLDAFLFDPKNIIPRQRRLKLKLNIASGLQYLHENDPPILHQDLKSPNCLLTAGLCVKLADFGMSGTKADLMDHQEFGGSMLWIAPEVLDEGRVGEPGDVFSVGIIMSEIENRHFPYEPYIRDLDPAVVFDRLYEGIVSGQLRPHTGLLTPPAEAELMSSCWHPDPERRPSAGLVARQLEDLLGALEASGGSCGAEAEDLSAIQLPSMVVGVPWSALMADEEVLRVTEWKCFVNRGQIVWTLDKNHDSLGDNDEVTAPWPKFLPLASAYGLISYRPGAFLIPLKKILSVTSKEVGDELEVVLALDGSRAIETIRFASKNVVEALVWVNALSAVEQLIASQKNRRKLLL